MRSYLVVICSVLFFYSYAQDIKGQIFDKDGSPILAATVYAKGKLASGVYSDLNGYFELFDLNVRDSIVISYVGYVTEIIPVANFKDGDPLRIILNEDFTALEEIVIKGCNPVAGSSSVTKVEKLDIYMNPFSQGDALKSVTGLAYSTTLNESANPSLRGSSASRTNVVFNRVPIYSPVRNSQVNGVGNFSLFNTQLVDRMYIYPSNPPLTFGNSSAGIIDVTTKQSIDYTETEASLTFVGAGILHSQTVNDELFFQAYSNYQNSRAFLEVNPESTENLNGFGSTDFGFNVNMNSNGWNSNLFLYGLNESYDVRINRFSYEGSAVAKSRRIFSVINLEKHFGSTLLTLDYGGDWKENHFAFGVLNSDAFTVMHYVSADIKKIFNNGFVLQTGIDNDFQSFESQQQRPEYFYALGSDAPSIQENIDLNNNLLESYIYIKKELRNKWRLHMGLRSNLKQFSYQGGATYEPNFRNKIIFSGGHYYSYSRPSIQRNQYDLQRSFQIAIDQQYRTDRLKFQSAFYFKSEIGDRTDDFFFIVQERRTLGMEYAIEYQVLPYLSVNMANTHIYQSQKIFDTDLRGPSHLPYFLKGGLIFSYPKWPSITVTYIRRPGSAFNPIIGGVKNEVVGYYEPKFSEELYVGQYNSYERLDIGINYYATYRKQSLVFFINVANALDRLNESSAVYNRDYTRLDFEYFQQRTLFAGVVWNIKTY